MQFLTIELCKELSLCDWRNPLSLTPPIAYESFGYKSDHNFLLRPNHIQDVIPSDVYSDIELCFEQFMSNESFNDLFFHHAAQHLSVGSSIFDPDTLDIYYNQLCKEVRPCEHPILYLYEN